MKKLIAALTLLLAFSINANAQSKKTAKSSEKARPEAITSHEKAINEATELTKFLDLNESQNANITMILEQKHQTLEVKDLSDERKTALSQAIDSQIKHYLNAEQVEKLEKNSDLHNRLLH